MLLELQARTTENYKYRLQRTTSDYRELHQTIENYTSTEYREIIFINFLLILKDPSTALNELNVCISQVMDDI